VSATAISTVLLFLGAFVLGSTPYLTSPWPGVVLCGLAVVSWGLGEWLAHAQGAEDASTSGLRDYVNGLAGRVSRSEELAREQGDQINSLRNAVSLRGTLGG
jgi:hypothetical protein